MFAPTHDTTYFVLSFVSVVSWPEALEFMEPREEAREGSVESKIVIAMAT